MHTCYLLLRIKDATFELFLFLIVECALGGINWLIIDSRIHQSKCIQPCIAAVMPPTVQQCCTSGTNLVMLYTRWTRLSVEVEPSCSVYRPKVSTMGVLLLCNLTPPLPTLTLACCALDGKWRAYTQPMHHLLSGMTGECSKSA